VRLLGYLKRNLLRCMETQT